MISGRTASFGFILSVICTGLNFIALVMLFGEYGLLMTIMMAASLISAFLLYVIFGIEVMDNGQYDSRL